MKNFIVMAALIASGVTGYVIGFYEMQRRVIKVMIENALYEKKEAESD